jgi:GDP-mannose 6-dehydrogenase
VVEPGLDALVGRAMRVGQLRASTDPVEAVRSAEILLVCVGTPCTSGGQVDLRAVREVVTEIGREVRTTAGHKTVIIRSTVPPGTCEHVVRPLLERHCRRQAGAGLGIVANPEFLREGSAVTDFDTPPYIIVGTDDRRAAEAAASLYRTITAPLYVTTFRVAELLKYACNAFHALKVTFANEIGALARELDLDGARVMDLLCRDRKLNISSRYLRPGFSFGGSCLSKDLRALTEQAGKLDVEMPLLRAIEQSNHAHFERGVETICALGRRRIAVLGLGFKAGTFDVRESPYVQLVERLLELGFDVRVYDPHASTNGNGAARSILSDRPDVRALLCRDSTEVVGWAEVAVVGSWRPPADLILALEWNDCVTVQLGSVEDSSSGVSGEHVTLWSKGDPPQVVPRAGRTKASGMASG